MPVNPAAVQAAWTAAKAHLATLQANLATVQANLATLEADCDTLYSQNAGDVCDWLRTNAKQTLQGCQPRVSAGGNIPPQRLSGWAPHPAARALAALCTR